MKCPACGNELGEMSAGEIKVDVCRGGCGGVWFDRFELQKVDEPHESAGAAILDEQANNLEVEPEKRLNCPKCDDVVMMRHFWSVKERITVDECPGCGGYWLDTGELAELRKLFKTEEERREAAKAYFSELFDEKLAGMRKESEEKLAKARKIAHAFRFLCPSYYMPGKQEWGAF